MSVRLCRHPIADALPDGRRIDTSFLPLPGPQFVVLGRTLLFLSLDSGPVMTFDFYPSPLPRCWLLGFLWTWTVSSTLVSLTFVEFWATSWGRFSAWFRTSSPLQGDNSASNVVMLRSRCVTTLARLHVLCPVGYFRVTLIGCQGRYNSAGRLCQVSKGLVSRAHSKRRTSHLVCIRKGVA